MKHDPTPTRSRACRKGAAVPLHAIVTVIVALFAGTCAPVSAFGQAFDLRGAIETAQPGDVINVPPGMYAGPFVLNKPLTLIAQGEVILDGGGDGDVVTVAAPDVTLRGFIIRNTGKSLDRENAGITVLAPRVTIRANTLQDVLFGIYLKGAEDSVIRGNTIGGKDLPVQRRGDGIRIWRSNGTVIENNVVRGSRDTVIWFSDDVHLINNKITGGRYGLHFMYSNRNVLEGNHLEGNSVGAFLMYSQDLTLRRNAFIRNRGPSGYGVGLKDIEGTSAEDNLFIGNRIGLRLDNSPSSTREHQLFQHNVFSHNDIGVAFQPAVKRNHFRENTFIDNLEQVAVLGRGNFSGNEFTVDGRGNFWSDYRGYDMDGDGIGDLAYVSESLFENLMDREPKLRLFLYSPAQQAIEMAAQAFPIMRPEPKFTDEAPLMAQVPVDVDFGADRSVWPMAALSVLLIAGAATAIRASRLMPRRVHAQLVPSTGADR